MMTKKTKENTVTESQMPVSLSGKRQSLGQKINSRIASTADPAKKVVRTIRIIMSAPSGFDRED
jgi:hypothetical protein